MKINMKRLLSMLMALCMVIGMVPSLALNAHAVYNGNVNIAIDAPVVGGTPDFVGEESADEYYVTNITWHNDTDHVDMLTTDIFEAGHDYTVKVRIAPNSTTADAFTSDVKVYLGDEEAEWELVDGIIIASVTFSLPEAEIETTNVVVAKVWNDENDFDKLRPESIQVQLYANGEGYGEPVVLNEAKEWIYTWEELDVATEDGTTIVYTVDELEVPEYYSKNIIDLSVPGSDNFTFVIENTHTPTSYVEFPITKVVKQGGNVAPGAETFTFEVFTLNPNGGEEIIASKTITTNGAETKGQYFTIEKSMLENGIFVREVKGSSEGWTYDEQLWLVEPAQQPMSVDDEVLIEQMNLDIFKVEIKDTHMDREPADEIVFTNTYTKNTVNPPVQEYDPEPTPKDKVVVKKVWVGDDEKTRPEEITVQLYKNGKKYENPVKLSADEDIYENWRHVWEDVNEDEDTVWSVKELNVPDGYSVSIEQRRSNYFIITNTLNEKANPETGASDFVGAAVALAVCSTVCGAALMLKRK